ncbi:uncharacterized protein CEXT_349781 [Caerostris extrusa]|uniref:Peptidase M12B propeptide domain-containing protein n=1 Tax=Caerostris extrusa TaxID=172846 RepID=A0AAV4QNA0_CAEEX|nr:uncharacterized protein CEXT_349781 [Caerostris extrusa]
MLLQNPHNQELVTHLGTRYEIVNPIQIRQEWGRRLSTRSDRVNGTITHLLQTSLFIETYQYKLHLDLELNINLFPSTLVQFIYEKGGPPLALQELPENCYYHATIRNYPEASAAFSTCDGISNNLFLRIISWMYNCLILEFKFENHSVCISGNHTDREPSAFAASFARKPFG